MQNMPEKITKFGGKIIYLFNNKTMISR